jgi:hypothetical protein
MIDDRLKKIIFKKLNSVLFDVELIRDGDSTWFISRNNRYWFLEYRHNDYTLWYRYQFFDPFFSAFSLKREEYELIIKEWVEKILDVYVEITLSSQQDMYRIVLELLNNLT